MRKGFFTTTFQIWHALKRASRYSARGRMHCVLIKHAYEDPMSQPDRKGLRLVVMLRSKSGPIPPH